MTKLTFALTMVFLLTISLNAQPPQAFKYQTVIRNASGEIMQNQAVGIRISIHDATAGGSIVYQETFSETTNDHGLVNLKIGSGTPSIGTFGLIDWGSAPKFLETEIDPAGGSSFVSMGTSELLSVPYALYSSSSGGNPVWQQNGNSAYYDQGPVGIGTSSPGAPLEVVGHIWQTGTGNSIFIGEGAGANDDLSSNFNTAVGFQAMHNNLLGDKSIAFGYKALYSNSTSSRNTAIGYQALVSNNGGYNNTATGYQSLAINSTGYENTAYGYQSLYGNTTGYANIAMGHEALYSNTIGDNNNATGYQALYSNITGYHNTASGYQALYNNSDGILNTAIGYQALYYNSSGALNTASGYKALSSNTTGYYNSASGSYALSSNTTGDNNTASGSYALSSNTIGYRNTASGYQALYYNTTGYLNTASGYQALYSNITGGENSANGYQALYSNTTGWDNTASGYKALYSNTTGYHNTAIGQKALSSNTTGDYNIASGFQALRFNITGSQNTANGYQALYFNSTGFSSTASGYQALRDNTTGGYNAAIGNSALLSNTTGSYNTALGYLAFTVGTNYSNSTALGYNAEPNASNTIRLGNFFVSTIGGWANWSNVSDGRFKTSVRENVVGLDFILKLRPVTYNLDMDAIAQFINTPDSLRLPESEWLKAAELQSGFIAQEVEAAANSSGYDFHGVDKPKNEKSHYGLRYAEFVVPLVKAVQELTGRNDQLSLHIGKQDETIEDLQTSMEELTKRLIELETKKQD